MNFDPNKYRYEIVPHEQSGVDVLLTRVETGQVKKFHLAAHTPESVGLHSHMESLTDELLLDFFEKKKKKDKKGKGA